MFASVMMPHTFGGPTMGLSHSAALAPSTHLPSRPSPLSSSPVRAPSPMYQASSPVRPSSPPMASSHFASRMLDTQSSPIQPQNATLNDYFERRQQMTLAAAAAAEVSPTPSNSSGKSLFRFASRPAKAVPRVPKSSEDARQTRRSLFLRNVRQRADDRAWDRRNCEQEIEKLEWRSLERGIRQAREADVMGMLTEHDIEDAAEWLLLQQQQQSASEGRNHYTSGLNGEGGHDDDDRMLDLNSSSALRFANTDEEMAEFLAQQEEAELDALFSSMADSSGPAPRPNSPHLSDDEVYDDVFAELMAQQQGGPSSSALYGTDEDMEML